MKRHAILAVLLLAAIPASAQVTVQTVTLNVNNYANPQAAYTMAFKQPNTAPCTLFLAVPRVIQAQHPVTITDSQNAWALAPGSTGLWYTTSCASGSNTVKAAFADMQYFQGVLIEVPGVWVPNKVSGRSSGASAITTSALIDANAGDLLLGYGYNDDTNYPGITAGTGFTLEGNANVFLETAKQAAFGTVTSSVTYSGSVSWHQNVASFSLATLPAPLQITVPGLATFTFPIADVSQVPACTLADGVCSLAIQVCDAANPPNCLTSAAGTLAIVKTATLPIPQTQTTLLVKASP